MLQDLKFPLHSLLKLCPKVKRTVLVTEILLCLNMKSLVLLVRNTLNYCKFSSDIDNIKKNVSRHINWKKIKGGKKMGKSLNGCWKGQCKGGELVGIVGRLLLRWSTTGGQIRHTVPQCLYLRVARVCSITDPTIVGLWSHATVTSGEYRQSVPCCRRRRRFQSTAGGSRTGPWRLSKSPSVRASVRPSRRRRGLTV